MNDQDKRIEQIKKILSSTRYSLDKMDHLLTKLGSATERDELLEMDGIEGVFDGFNMVDGDGKPHEVPLNYAAKSRLVYGDKLKMVEKDGKRLFKQITKVPRKISNGIATKKEGLWYVITDTGSYKISDVAAEFNAIKINEELVVIIPEDNLKTPFATLDNVIRPDDHVMIQRSKEPAQSEKRVGDSKKPIMKSAKTSKPKPKKPVNKPFVKNKNPDPGKKTVSKDKEFVNGITEKNEEPKKDDPKETQSTIVLEEDDLR
jgi:uncharacterized pyridoxamine 5'-phosphate oxidase family protein